MKPASPPVLRATRLLDLVRERIRSKHYSFAHGAVPRHGVAHRRTTALWQCTDQLLWAQSGHHHFGELTTFYP